MREGVYGGHQKKYGQGMIRLFSKFGTPSTGLEKGLLVLVLLSVGGIVAVRQLKDADVHKVFAAASQAAKSACQSKTGSSSNQAYYDCIADSKDPDFLKAASKYALDSGLISIRPAP